MSQPRTMAADTVEELDVLGVGAGPFNLSTAALLSKAEHLTARFLDSKEQFSWHPGLLFRDATIQTSYLKDCVTLVDPTSPYSFLNYLSRHRRLNRFIAADFPHVRRAEFGDYFGWVSRQLDSVRFGTRVHGLESAGGVFTAETDRGRYRAKDVVIGVGREPFVPEGARGHLGDTVFHGVEYLLREADVRDKRVAVVGGGQTGAEIFNDLISTDSRLPREVTWVTRRSNFSPYEESPFANELYVPGYTRHFTTLTSHERRRLLSVQKLTSEGVVQPLLEAIHRRLYEFDYLETQRLRHRLLVERELTKISPAATGWLVQMKGPAGSEAVEADIVILATGFSHTVPTILDGIRHRLSFDSDGQVEVEEDFSLRWDGSPDNRIFVHNMALHTHGWIDPNFVGMAWRSAVIVNRLAGRYLYDVDVDGTTVDWGGKTTSRQEPVTSLAEAGL